MRRLIIASLCVAACFATTALVQASPITWTINATLANGANVNGTFVFDPDLGPNQTITTFDVSVGAGASIPPSFVRSFPAFDFTPSNSYALGEYSGYFAFGSLTSFPNPPFPNESLILQFVPRSPLTDLSSTLITNGTISLDDGHSNECFNCNPYICFEGATSSLCTASPTAPVPEPASLLLLGSGLAGLAARRKRLTGRKSSYRSIWASMPYVPSSTSSRRELV